MTRSTRGSNFKLGSSIKMAVMGSFGLTIVCMCQKSITTKISGSFSFRGVGSQPLRKRLDALVQPGVENISEDPASCNCNQEPGERSSLGCKDERSVQTH